MEKYEKNEKNCGKAALVCCSNGLEPSEQERIEKLQRKLIKLGFQVCLSPYLYAREGCFSGTGKERADCLMSYLKEPDMKAVFDVSGGDIANELLPFLNYREIADSDTVFCGYSDLTTVMNAIYAKAGKASLWYQAKNLVGKEEEQQTALFGKPELFQIQGDFQQGTEMEGVLVGGNIRCLLKLAGTPYWPDMKGKLLFLEARSGSQAQMTAYLNQLKQMGVFEEIQGILLGTFLQMEKEEPYHKEACFSMVNLVKRYAGDKLPIVSTKEVGHRSDSKALWIGKEYTFWQGGMAVR